MRKDSGGLHDLTEQDILDGRLWTEEEVGEYLGVSPKTLPRWRMEGRGPAYVKLMPGRLGLVRYRVKDVVAWVNARVRNSTREGSGE